MVSAEIFFKDFFFYFFHILVSMATNENDQRVNNHTYDTSLVKEIFCKSFVELSAMA